MNDEKKESGVSEFQNIRDMVDEACEASKFDDKCEKDAINWSGLSCVQVFKCEDEKGVKLWVVTVEEADPSAHNLRRFIYDYCHGKGVNWVEVFTDW